MLSRLSVCMNPLTCSPLINTTYPAKRNYSPTSDFSVVLIEESQSGFRGLRLPLMLRSGQMVAGETSSALAISHSPFGHGRVRAFDSVEEASPASREISARLVLRLRSAAIISAGGTMDPVSLSRIEIRWLCHFSSCRFSSRDRNIQNLNWQLLYLSKAVALLLR
ncbi:hypothetical protein LG58_3356 [Kosakonia radicincitans YD4]|nr:hypothetical protein LG58_3356 [Kosakonia radicincitans YD4]